MAADKQHSEPGFPLNATFLTILLMDVDAAMSRRSKENNGAHRRELIRTAFAAIEGVIWAFRERIAFVAGELGILEIAEQVALRETSYAVTEKGKVIEQPRYLSMSAAFRLTSRIAARIAPEIDNPFSGSGWDTFRAALDIRHRVTHPKSAGDLAVGDAEITTALDSFYWAMEVMMTAMQAVDLAYGSWIAEMQTMLDGLKRGDPAILETYRQIRDEGD